MAEQLPPRTQNVLVAEVVGHFRHDVEDVPSLLELADNLFDRDVTLQIVADDLLDLRCTDGRVGTLIASDEDVALLLALLPAVRHGVPRHEIQGQLVAFRVLTAAAGFQVQIGEVVFDLDA